MLESGQVVRTITWLFENLCETHVSLRPGKHRICGMQVKDTITQDQYKEYVELHKRKEHHIFTVESTNSIPAAVLFTRAIRILREKSQCLRNML